ncbi:MAG: hypothetical protein HW419_3106 [Deltaproteobacteria bacterium]|nr:hypothetical protein [Deltaproteobacteria bacterium]
MEYQPPVSDRLVRRLQWIWVARLDDVIQASVGISIVAIPIFLVFMGVIFYVFWGVALNGRKRED